jgi:hypothetical protein
MVAVRPHEDTIHCVPLRGGRFISEVSGRIAERLYGTQPRLSRREPGSLQRPTYIILVLN